MPPVHSKGSRPDFTGTPRGFRSEKGRSPCHQAKGGKSDYSENPKGRGKGRDQEKEQRTSVIEDAFQADLNRIQDTAKDFQEALCLVLRRQTAINSPERHEELLNNETFIKGSKHFSYVFRHSLLPHEDGSLSLNELLNHRGSQVKLRSMRNHGPEILLSVNKSILRSGSRHQAIQFLLPLAHAICSSNKDRTQFALMSVSDFRPGTTPSPEAYFSPSDFTDTASREALADEIEAIGVASVFIRYESGHSNETVPKHPLFNSSEFPNSYLLHGTHERNLSSIRQNGLMPGGTRRSRKDVHFTLDFTLSTMVDSLRPESDCILVYKIDALDDLEPRITRNHYVLTESTVPANRLIGAWSLQDSRWLVKPCQADFAAMSNIRSDVDLLLHIAHHQRYWKKREENEETGIIWSRQQYQNHVIQYLKTQKNVENFFACWIDDPVPAAPPTRRKQFSNPNERELHEKDAEDREREKNIKEIKQRFLANVQKEQKKKFRADNLQDTSDSDASVKISGARLGVGDAIGFMKEKLEQKAKAKARTIKVWKVKSDKSDTAPTYAEVASSSDRPAKTTNKQTEAARKTHKYAKEMLRDADLARQVYDRIQDNLTQDFTSIQWWSRPEGHLDCSNIADCSCTNAIFWCHVCGKAFCIVCRHQGIACSHDIACYSSELSDFLTPDSIGAPGTNVDIDDLIEDSLGRAPYFGESKVEQSDYRKDQYNDLVRSAEQGASVSGNTFLRAYLSQGIEEFAFADYIYFPDETASRIPTPYEHFVLMQDYSALPIWRPQALINCKYTDLTVEEYLMLLELYRSVMVPRSSHSSGNYRSAETCNYAQKESYHIALLNLNLDHINRQPVVAGHHKFPSTLRNDDDTNTTLPYLVLRNGAHITTLCEASDDKGGIERHDALARQNGVLGMVVHAEGTAPSLACFLYGTHANGHFVELLAQFQHETENKEKHNKFWILHACIFRCAFGHNTSGEMMDPSTGIWTSTGDEEPSMTNAVAPASDQVLASTHDHP